MKNKIKLEASSFELIKQDKANIILKIEVIKPNRADVQKDIKKKADAVFKLLHTFNDVNSSTQDQTISENLVQKQNKWEKEGYKGIYSIQLIGYNFDQLNEAIGAVENHAQVASITTSISNRTKAAMEDKLTQQAIENFKIRAKLVSDSFGFNRFTIEKTEVSRAQGEDDYSNFGVANTMMAGGGRATTSNSFYVQPRDERITLTVKGTIQLV